LFFNNYAYCIEIDQKYIDQLNNIQQNLFKDTEKIKNGQIKYSLLKEKNLKIDITDVDADAITLYVKNGTEASYHFSISTLINSYTKYLNEHNASQSVRRIIYDALEQFADSSEDYLKKQQINDQMFFSGKITAGIHFRKSENSIGELESKIDTVKKEMLVNMEDISNKRIPRFAKQTKQRELAKNDPVAQVLNYASGAPEDASGMSFYYPESIGNGQCIYKLTMDKSNPFASGIMDLLNASSAILSNPLFKEDAERYSPMLGGLDLTKSDLKNVAFYTLQGAKKNQFTGATAYLRYQSRVEGLPDIFECDSKTCNIDRLKRGWALVASKCKGTKKAF
jgi:hypothetical protein